jgi:hypothetical protein
MNLVIIDFRRLIAVISLLMLFASPAAAQPRRPFEKPELEPVEAGTATIAGRAIDVVSKKPVPNVEIQLVSYVNGIARGLKAKTDQHGAYTFTNVAEGTYSIGTANNQTDYVPGCYVTSDAPERCANVSVLRDQMRTDIDIGLAPLAIARGRVVNSAGSPIAGATVRLGSPARPSTSITHTIYSGAVTQTGADGAFEVRRILPGEWNLELDVPAANRDSVRLPVMFYPGVFRAEDAARIEFVPGRIVEDLVFVIPAVADNTLTIRIAAGPVAMGDLRTAFVGSVPQLQGIKFNEDGVATIKGLLEGRYFMSARAWTDDQAWAAFAITDFIAPSLDVPLQMHRAAMIRGRIVAQNGGLPPLDGVVVAALWVDEGVEINPLAKDQVPAEPDGSFRIGGLFGRRAFQLLGLAPEWRVHSILQGRSEITSGIDVPFDATLDVTIVVTHR